MPAPTYIFLSLLLMSSLKLNVMFSTLAMCDCDIRSNYCPQCGVKITYEMKTNKILKMIPLGFQGKKWMETGIASSKNGGKIEFLPSNPTIGDIIILSIRCDIDKPYLFTHDTYPSEYNDVATKFFREHIAYLKGALYYIEGQLFTKSQVTAEFHPEILLFNLSFDNLFLTIRMVEDVEVNIMNKAHDGKFALYATRKKLQPFPKRSGWTSAEILLKLLGADLSCEI
jgi:hypothetical protein